jgi:hypothetical protein
MFTEWDYSLSEVISSTVAHAVTLLKSYMPDVDPELLRKEYRCKDDDERDALIESAPNTYYMNMIFLCPIIRIVRASSLLM